MKINVPDTGDVTTNSLLAVAYKDGAEEAFKATLNFLQDKYLAVPIEVQELAEGARTPEQLAILEVAKQLGIFINTERASLPK